MLPKKYRICKYRDLKKIWLSRSFVREGSLKAQYILKNRFGYPRMTVTVSNKVLPRATKRNYFKRQIRALFAETIKKYPLMGIDLIVSLVDAEAIGNYPEDYKKIITRILNQIKI